MPIRSRVAKHFNWKSLDSLVLFRLFPPLLGLLLDDVLLEAGEEVAAAAPVLLVGPEPAVQPGYARHLGHARALAGRLADDGEAVGGFVAELAMLRTGKLALCDAHRGWVGPVVISFRFLVRSESSRARGILGQEPWQLTERDGSTDMYGILDHRRLPGLADINTIGLFTPPFFTRVKSVVMAGVSEHILALLILTSSTFH